MRLSRRVAYVLPLMGLGIAALLGRARWLREHPFTDDANARLGLVAGHVEACLRQYDLVLSRANAAKLGSCVCAGGHEYARGYCYVGDGFVAFGGGAAMEGVFRVAGDPANPTQGMAYVPQGTLGPSAQEFDRNFGSFGPSSGPRSHGWYRIEFCPGCD